MVNWYYVNPKTSEKCGPYEESAVRRQYIEGNLPPTALVWHEGLANWISAAQAFAALDQRDMREGQVPLPDGLRGWMSFTGICLLLCSILPALMLWGIPLLIASISLLHARRALDRTPYVAEEMLPFLLRLRRIFCALGWGWILLFFGLVALYLLSTAVELQAISDALSGTALWPFAQQ